MLPKVKLAIHTNFPIKTLGPLHQCHRCPSSSSLLHVYTSSQQGPDSSRFFLDEPDFVSSPIGLERRIVAHAKVLLTLVRGGLPECACQAQSFCTILRFSGKASKPTAPLGQQKEKKNKPTTVKIIQLFNKNCPTGITVPSRLLNYKSFLQMGETPTVNKQSCLAGPRF